LRPAAAGQGGAPFRLWKEDCFFGFAVGKKLALGASVRQNDFFPIFSPKRLVRGSAVSQYILACCLILILDKAVNRVERMYL
jgi:hypothetical protein